VIALLFISFLLNRGPQWPQIPPAEHHYVFREAEDPQIDLAINDLKGMPAYRLECHDPSYVDDGFDYSGIFQCRLVAIGTARDHRAHWDLLSDDPKPTRDWQSRGRFLPEHFAAGCAEVPDYGNRRTFGLRRMTIVLEAARTISPEGIPLVKLDVQVRQDKKTKEWYTALPDKTNPLFIAGNGNELAQKCEFWVPQRERESKPTE